VNYVTVQEWKEAVPQAHSGWEFYWRHHPREICPNCGKKTFIQPSESEGWNDNAWQYITLDNKRIRAMPKRCYKCGYIESLDSLQKRKEQELKTWRERHQ